MTPEREKYLAKCSEREMWIRRQISSDKRELSNAKIRLKVFREELLEAYELGKWFAVREKQQIDIMLKVTKYRLTVCKQALARLKGVDRVVVPKVTYIGFGGSDFLQRVERCTCGERLMGENYCPECGRRILRKKVR